MDDAISRKRLINRLKHRRDMFCKNRIEFLGLSKNDKARVDEMDACIAEMINAPTIEPERKKGEWIPCSERLPDDDEIVLVSDGIDYAVAFWRSDADAWDDPLHGWLDSFEFNVKAWMPLPDPYTERREE